MNIAIIRVCVCVCDSVCLFVCPHDKTKTAETTITKLAIGIVQQLILGQKPLKVTKCKNIGLLKAIMWPA